MDIHALEPAHCRYRNAHPLRRRLVRGVTIIEALAVLAILGVLLAGAVPSLARFVSNHRASTTVNELLHGLSLARSEALKRSRRVYLAPFDGRWRNGWAVFVDRNDNRVFDPPVGLAGDELIARHDALPASISISNPSNPSRESFTDVGSPPRTYILFDGSGYPRQRNGALNMGSLVVTDRTGDAVTERTICVAAHGRVRVVVDRAGCG